jgi:hypothetical protein
MRIADSAKPRSTERHSKQQRYRARAEIDTSARLKDGMGLTIFTILKALMQIFPWVVIGSASNSGIAGVGGSYCAEWRKEQGEEDHGIGRRSRMGDGESGGGAVERCGKQVG